MSASVLIIEDDMDLASTLAEVLGDEGYQVSTLSRSDQVLEHLHDQQAPDVILLDLMMPLASGWEVCQQLSAEPRLRAIPVILMTAAANLRLPLPSHPRTVLHKPFILDELLDEVGRLTVH